MSRMRYFGIRTIQTVFMLWAALTFLFVFFRFMPGDFGTIMLGRGASPETVATLREEWALNEPIYEQYVRYMGNLVVGNLGASIEHQIPVWDYVAPRMLNSIILGVPAVVTAYVLGSAFGTVLGSVRGSSVEKYATIPVIALGMTPSFVIGILLIIVFSGGLGWFPSGRMLSPELQSQFLQGERALWRQYVHPQFVWHLALPFSAIVLRRMAFPVLVMRTSVVESLSEDFAYYMRVTGLSRVTRLTRISRHSVLPVLTIFPIALGQTIGGLIVLETVFNWPGMGKALVDAVLARDFPVIQFVFFLIAAFIIVGNFVVDVLYGVIDPRISVDE